MFLFLNSTVVNPSFSSQTKEKLITEVNDFGNTFEISNKLVNSILKSEIVNSILDWVQQKKTAEDSKLQRELNKKLSKIKVEKLIDAKGKDRTNCILGLYEGDSAASAIRKYRNPMTMGAFALRGKVLNVSEVGNQKLVQNVEIVNVMATIGLKLGQKAELNTLRYGKILFYVDADCLEENTLILTENGSKKIKDLTYDDKVLTHTGEYKKILNIVEKDISKYIIIKVNGNTICCSKNHRLMINRNDEIIDIEANDILYTDFLMLKNKKDKKTKEYKLVSPESIRKIDGIKKFIDIEVENDNTFYIVGENDLILSHNCDGNAIAGLLINLFHKYWPEMFDNKMIYKVETPIVVAESKKGKNKLFFYNQTEYDKWISENEAKLYNIEYKKGLAALVDDEYKDIISNPKLTLITKDDLSKDSLDIWFGKNSELRKNELLD